MPDEKTELGEMLKDGYLMSAPKRLRARVEAAADSEENTRRRAASQPVARRTKRSNTTTSSRQKLRPAKK